LESDVSESTCPRNFLTELHKCYLECHFFGRQRWPVRRLFEPQDNFPELRRVLLSCRTPLKFQAPLYSGVFLVLQATPCTVFLPSRSCYLFPGPKRFDRASQPSQGIAILFCNCCKRAGLPS